MTQHPALPDIDAATADEIDALVRRCRDADGEAMRLMAWIGDRAEGLLDNLPAPVRRNLDGATRRALEISSKAARASHARVPSGADWLTTVVTTAMGAAGGFGGMPTALAELPVTTTVLLRAIQGIAAEHGFDTADPEVQAQCLQVFAAAGPLTRDDDFDIAFLTTRISVTGATVHGVIAKVAPRLAAVLGQKVAAQTVPVMGAVAGAAINYAFTSYYQEMARVYFGLRALSRDRGVAYDTVMEEFRLRFEPPRAVA